ncbi:hypothetical protein B566_EDAN016187, partial [Ephemera danica]
GVFGSIYQCVLCEVKISTFCLIIQHLFNEHQLSKLPYQCNICQCRQFISKRLLMNHELICNKTTLQVNYNDLQLNDIQQIAKEIPCQEIVDHTITIESEDELLSLPEHQINNEAVLRQHNKKHPVRRLQCEHCGLRFAHREMLKWHIEQCHGPDPKIKVIQNDEAVLRQQNKKHPVRRLQCEHCGLRFAHREMLKWHIEQCHGPDPKIKVIQNGNNMVVGFKCIFCEAEFNRFNVMIQHQRYQHQLSILPFQCNICKCRQFTCKFNLKAHKLMCKKRKLQVDQNIIHMNDDPQYASKEIKDHTIKVETGNDKLDLPEHRIIGE